MADIHHSSTAKAPADLMFAYMDDHRQVPKWMFGLSRMEPVGEQESGVGAVFDGSMKLGPKTLHSTVDFTYELPGVIEPFVSIAIKHTESQLRDQVERLHAEQNR